MSDENDLNKKIMLEGESVSLADLAGLDMDTVVEKRGESFPKGDFTWEIDTEDAPKLVVIGEGEKARGAVQFVAKCLDVVRITDPEFSGDQNALIGKKHREAFFITTLESVGYIKAFFKDIGAPYNKDFNILLSGSAGTRFNAPIGKRKDPNDTDKVYTQIVRNKVKPLAGATESSVAKAVA